MVADVCRRLLHSRGFAPTLAMGDGWMTPLQWADDCDCQIWAGRWSFTFVVAC